MGGHFLAGQAAHSQITVLASSGDDEGEPICQG
jgi:hypothetical protein